MILTGDPGGVLFPTHGDVDHGTVCGDEGNRSHQGQKGEEVTSGGHGRLEQELKRTTRWKAIKA